MGSVNIKQKNEGSMPKVKGYHFYMGPEQVGTFKKALKKVVIMIGVKFSAESSCVIKMLVKKSQP